MHQSSYIMEILDRFGMTDCKPVGTPMDSNVKLIKPDETDQGEKKVPYRELIGALMYLAVSTRPDIAYTVSSLSQFNDCNGPIHWTAAKRVLRYLKGTINQRLIFKQSTEPLQCYVDTDWGGCLNNRRSYTVLVTILSKGPISLEATKAEDSGLVVHEGGIHGTHRSFQRNLVSLIFTYELRICGPLQLHCLQR